MGNCKSKNFTRYDSAATQDYWKVILVAKQGSFITDQDRHIEAFGNESLSALTTI